MTEPTEDFAAMFEASTKARRIAKGQTLEGTIVGIGPEVAFVDVGGKGEATLLQVVVGREASYAVQRAWRGDAFRGTALPAEARALVADWQRQLDTVRLCDTRLPERACKR